MDDVELEEVEPLIDAYGGYCNDTLSLIYQPFFTGLIWVYYDETVVASLYGIRKRENCYGRVMKIRGTTRLNPQFVPLIKCASRHNITLSLLCAPQVSIRLCWAFKSCWESKITTSLVTSPPSLSFFSWLPYVLLCTVSV